MKCPRWTGLVKLIIPAIILYALFMLADSGQKRAEGEALLSELREQAESIRRENEALEREIAASGSDEVIASVARERFGLVMPGEKVFYDLSEHDDG